MRGVHAGGGKPSPANRPGSALHGAGSALHGAAQQTGQGLPCLHGAGESTRAANQKRYRSANAYAHFCCHTRAAAHRAWWCSTTYGCSTTVHDTTHLVVQKLCLLAPCVSELALCRVHPPLTQHQRRFALCHLRRARARVCVCSCNTGGAGMCLYARPCLFEWVGRHACMTEGCGANAATQSSHAAAWVADSHTGKRCMALALEFAACVGRCTSSYSSGCAPLRPSNARAAQQAAQGTAGKVSLATTAARGSSQQQESQSSS